MTTASTWNNAVAQQSTATNRNHHIVWSILFEVDQDVAVSCRSATKRRHTKDVSANVAAKT